VNPLPPLGSDPHSGWSGAGAGAPRNQRPSASNLTATSEQAIASDATLPDRLHVPGAPPSRQRTGLRLRRRPASRRVAENPGGAVNRAASVKRVGRGWQPPSPAPGSPEIRRPPRLQHRLDTVDVLGVPGVPVSNYKRMRLWVLSCPSSTGGLGITGENYSSAITWHTCHTSHTTNDHGLSGCASCVSVLRKKTEVTLGPFPRLQAPQRGGGSGPPRGAE
jgi:hypothetical protein